MPCFTIYLLATWAANLGGAGRRCRRILQLGATAGGCRWRAWDGWPPSTTTTRDICTKYIIRSVSFASLVVFPVPAGRSVLIEMVRRISFNKCCQLPLCSPSSAEHRCPPNELEVLLASLAFVFVIYISSSSFLSFSLSSITFSIFFVLYSSSSTHIPSPSSSLLFILHFLSIFHIFLPLRILISSPLLLLLLHRVPRPLFGRNSTKTSSTKRISWKQIHRKDR